MTLLHFGMRGGGSQILSNVSSVVVVVVDPLSTIRFYICLKCVLKPNYYVGFFSQLT